MVILNTADFANNNGIKVLCFGKSGVGKTRLASTAESPFVGSAESGLLSLSRWNIPYCELKRIEDVFDFWRWLATSHEARQFNDIFLDSLSDVMEVLLAQEKANNKDPRKAYGALADRGVELARAFRDIKGKNIWILCKEELSKDENSGTSMIQPWLPGTKLGPALPYYFDEVFRYEVGMDTSVVPHAQWEALRCRASQFATAKDRSGRLNEYELPNVRAITAKILGRTA